MLQSYLLCSVISHWKISLSFICNLTARAYVSRERHEQREGGKEGWGGLFAEMHTQKSIHGPCVMITNSEVKQEVGWG